MRIAGGVGNEIIQNGYTLVDARIAYDWQLNNGDSLMLSVIGKNLNDKEYKQQELPLGEFGGFRGWGPPRQIAAELMWRH